MRDSEKQRFISECKHRIQDFKGIIENVLDVPSDYLYPIYDALESIQISEEKLSYKICKLILPIENTKHVRPEGLQVQLQLDMSVEVNLEKWHRNEDPYSKYNFAITLFGNLEGMEHSICWHVDRDSPESSDEIHPLYHLQHSNGSTYHRCGETIDFNWGNSMFLDVPRIVHYPLDLFVGLSFIVTNFYKKSIMDKLQANQIYSYRINESTNKVLMPYFCAIAQKWEDIRISNLHDYHTLCPFLP